MRNWLLPLALVGGLAAGLVSGAEVLLTSREEDRPECQGMYARKAWGGKFDPAILVKFTPSQEDKIVSMVVFEWEDRNYIGRYRSKDDLDKEYICSEPEVKAKLCNSTEIGEFITEPETEKSSKGSIYTTAVKLKEAKPFRYKIEKTGYYCVQIYGLETKEFSAVVEFKNSFGELPAAQIAKLPFYGGLTILYALISFLWGFLYFQHRSDILPVQNYITAILLFLVIEMLVTWGFYEYSNNYGTAHAGSKVFMIAVAVLNAARNSFSFFLLLIVCMGYGVVKHTLGSTMTLVRILAIVHFVFGMIYAVASLTITPEQAGPLVLLVILPLSASLTAFYIWTLNSLKFTMKDLEERKQNVKLLMYKRLWWLILGSIFVIFGFFFINSLTFAGQADPNFAPDHWKTRWFVLDGWLNLVYMVDLAIIAYIWRPTANNRRFAMSDEISQEDDGFEIASLGGSDDEDDDDLEQGRAQGGARTVEQTTMTEEEMIKKEQELRKAEERRRELAEAGAEGANLFSVESGDEDDWSDSDDGKAKLKKGGKDN